MCIRDSPKKGLDRLVRAWSQIENSFSEWELMIVGPDKNEYAQSIRQLITDLGLQQAHIAGPVFGSKKEDLLRNADIFALPTLNENFAVTVAESLAVETPVISTKGAPWQGLETHKCGWWIDHGIEPMVAALQTAMNLPDSVRANMGSRGRVWMANDFSWNSIAIQMAEVYDWLLGEGDMPNFVHS